MMMIPSFYLIHSCQVYWETYITPFIDPLWKKISPYVLPVYKDLHKAARMWWKALKSGDINRIKKGKLECNQLLLC